MKIAVLGAGATGSVFASYLKLGGEDVWLIDPYKEHMDAIARDGMLFNTPEGSTKIRGFHTGTSPEGMGVMDLVIVLTKSTNTEDGLSSMSDCIGEDTAVLSLQNGLGNVEKIVKFVPRDRVMYGSGNIGTELPRPGECTAKTTQGIQLHFGAVVKNELTSRIGEELAGAFYRGGCIASFDSNISYYVWRKAVANISANALMGVLRLNAGNMYANRHAHRIFDNILAECIRVANELGIDGDSIYEFCKEPVLGSMRDYYSSTAQDMLKYKRKTEIESLNGAISQYGRELGIPTPYNDCITDMVMAIEENYSRQYSEN